MYIQDFEVETAGAATLDVDAASTTHFEDAFAAVWRGDAENDGFNRLMLAAGLDWRQVAMLRGYCKYLLQTGVPFSQAYMEETLRPLSAAGAPAGGAVRGALRSGHRPREQGRDREGRQAAARAADRALPAATSAPLATSSSRWSTRAPATATRRSTPRATRCSSHCWTASPASTRTASCAASSA